MAASTPSQSNGTVAIPHAKAMETFEDFKSYLGSRAESETKDIATELAADQLAAIIASDNEDAMWAADELKLEAGKDIADREMVVYSFSVHEGSGRFNAPLGHYVVVQAAWMDTGESFTWNTGSPLVIGKLRWLEAHNALPKEVVIRSIETPNGARLRLERVTPRAAKTTAS